jgi:hypothetical protein
VPVAVGAPFLSVTIVDNFVDITLLMIVDSALWPRYARDCQAAEACSPAMKERPEHG